MDRDTKRQRERGRQRVRKTISAGERRRERERERDCVCESETEAPGVTGLARLGDDAAIGSQAGLVDTVWVMRQVSSKGDRQLTLTLGNPGVSCLIPTACHSAQLVPQCW